MPESQSLTVLSADADAICFPSGENATAQTPPVWPSSCFRIFQEKEVADSGIDSSIVLVDTLSASVSIDIRVS